MSDNQVTLTGNLTDDPELRFTPNGVAVANFRLAVDQRVWDTDGWKDGEASYFRVNVWRDQAEHVSRSLTRAPAAWSWAGSRAAPGRPRRASGARPSRSTPRRWA